MLDMVCEKCLDVFQIDFSLRAAVLTPEELCTTTDAAEVTFPDASLFGTLFVRLLLMVGVL